MGTPTKRSTKVEAEILERLSKGETLTSICRDEDKPSPTTWREWCRADQALDIAHARARDDGFDAIAQDALSIADDGSRDYAAEDGQLRLDRDHIQRSKLRVETRLKLLAKWDPKRYGDRMQLAGDPESPLNGMTDEAIDAKLAALLANKA